ncbi:MAG: acyl-CoA dehydrogenase family protein [Chloroflexota bacterium]|nr:acyl-CoA dehydrogenase family protein [Chloroflexota bacterium]
MDFELTQEQRMFQDAVRKFAQKEIAPLVDEAEEKERFPLQLFPMMGDLGYLCVGYPRKYGAAEMGKLSECLMVEEVARVCGGISSAIMVHSGIGSSLICDHGSEELKQKFLVPAIQGKKIGAFGLTEPNAGSDAAAIQTTAKKDGDEYVINGTKTFITNGPICDYVLVAAYTDRSKGPRAGVSVFVVEKGTPGFTMARHLSKVGNRSGETGELAFQDCRVPATRLIGEEGKGFPYLMGSLAAGRISHAGRSVGISQAAYDASVKYAQERVQFGQPIGKFQAIAFKVANMATELEAARWLSYRAAWLYDQKRPCMKEASMCKLFASEVAIKATNEAMQIHAGYGYMMESPVQRYFRDARLYTITEGTSEIQLQVIARDIGLL